MWHSMGILTVFAPDYCTPLPHLYPMKLVWPVSWPAEEGRGHLSSSFSSRTTGKSLREVMEGSNG